MRRVNDMEDAMELRLLRCFLAGPKKSGVTTLAEVEFGDRIMANVADEVNGAANLEAEIRYVVGQIEVGSYAAALASKSIPIILGQFPALCAPTFGGESTAKEFYEFIESKITAFLSLERQDGSAELVEEGEQRQRGVLVMGLGVAALCAFVQANMTGPTQEQFMACPAHAALHDSSTAPGVDEQEWEAWARLQLMVDGCDILGKLVLPQYLILAKLLLVNPAEIMVKDTESECRGSRTWSWWAFRALVMQQRVLAERSASLRSLLVTTSSRLTKYFGTPEAVKRLGWNLHTAEVRSMIAAAHLEMGLMEHLYGHDDTARHCFDRASKSCGLELGLTGVLGFRTEYQVDPKAQMVLVANSKSLEDEANWLDFLDGDENVDDTTVQTERSDILRAPKLVNAAIEDNSVEYGKSADHGHHCVLGSVEQAIILARGVDVKKSNPDDELRSWQMAPFIEAVDSQHRSHPMIKAWCQLLRIRWEKTRARTRERCFLMMEKLASDIQEGLVKVAQRMCYAFCIPFPILPALLKEHAELMISFGLIGDAMRLFEELELWNNLIDCYCLLGKKTAAAGLIRQRLEIQPHEPRLWCSLGDVIMDDNCYHKAWEVSGRHFTRAQRSLARTAYNRGNYAQAIQHWDLALALNPLHPDGWFALGSAALKVRDLDKALVAFTRQVQLDSENGESWNNIAAINMQMQRSKEAFIAFREALKLKRNVWQIWENFAQVALDVGNFGQAVLAVENVFDLSKERKIDIDVLTKIMEELELRKHAALLPTLIPEPSRVEDNESGSLDNPSISRSVALLSNAPAKDDEQLSVEGSGNTPCQNSISSSSKETELLVERVGKLLSKIAAIGSGGGEMWGLKARWHKLVGEMSMCIEALLKQVRAYQGSKWQSSPEKFQIFAQSCLELCEAYMDSGSSLGGNRELHSAQMLLQNTVKQAGHFNSSQKYKDLELCLQKVQQKVQVL